MDERRTRGAFYTLCFPTLERELRDPAFIEITETECDHSLVLLLGRARERKMQAGLRTEDPRDGRIFRRMCCREKTRVVAILHVLAIGFQHLRICAGLQEHLPQHPEIEAE